MPRISRQDSKVTITDVPDDFDINGIDFHEDPLHISNGRTPLPDGFRYLPDDADDGSGLGYVRSATQPSTPNQPTPTSTPNQPTPTSTPNQPTPTSTPNQPTPAPEPYFSFFRKLMKASSNAQAPTPLSSTPASASAASSSVSEPAPSTKSTKATSLNHISSATTSSIFSKEEQDQIDLANYFSKHHDRLISEPWQNTQDLLNGLLSIYRNKITTCDLNKEETKNALKSIENTIEKFEKVVTEQARLWKKPLVIVKQTSNKDIPEFRKTSSQSQQPQIIYRVGPPTIELVSEKADNLRQHQQALKAVKKESAAAVLACYRLTNPTADRLEKVKQKLANTFERETQIEKEAKKDILDPSLPLSQCIEKFNEIAQLYQEIPQNQRSLEGAATYLLLKNRLIKFEEQIVNRAAKENKVEELKHLRSLANKEDIIFLEASNEFEALGPEERLFWESKLETLEKSKKSIFFSEEKKRELELIKKSLEDSLEKGLLTANDLKYYVTLCNNISRLYRQLPSDAQCTEKGKNLFKRLVSFQQQVIERAVKEKATIEILSPLSDELHNSPEKNTRILLNEEIPLKDRIISSISPYSRKELSNVSYVTQDLFASLINTTGFGIRCGWQATKNLAVASAPWTGAYAMQYINQFMGHESFDEASTVEGLLNCPPNVMAALIAFSALALTYNNAPKLPEGSLSSLSHTGPLAIKTAIKTAGILLAAGVAASMAGVIDGPAVVETVGNTAIEVGGSVLQAGLGVIPVPNLSNISAMYSGSNIEALAGGIYDNSVSIGIGTTATLTATFLIRSILALNHSKSNSIATVQEEEKPNEANNVGAKEAEKEEEGTNPAPSAETVSLDQVPSTNGTPPLVTTSSRTEQVARAVLPIIGLVVLGTSMYSEYALGETLNEALPPLATTPENYQTLTQLVRPLLPSPEQLSYFTTQTIEHISNPMIAAAALATVVGIAACRYRGVTLSDAGSGMKTVGDKTYSTIATVTSSVASGVTAVGGTVYNLSASGAAAVSGVTSTMKSFFSWGKKPPVEEATTPKTQDSERSNSPSSKNKRRQAKRYGNKNN